MPARAAATARASAGRAQRTLEAWRGAPAAWVRVALRTRLARVVSTALENNGTAGRRCGAVTPTCPAPAIARATPRGRSRRTTAALIKASCVAAPPPTQRATPSLARFHSAASAVRNNQIATPRVQLRTTTHACRASRAPRHRTRPIPSCATAYSCLSGDASGRDAVRASPSSRSFLQGRTSARPSVVRTSKNDHTICAPGRQSHDPPRILRISAERRVSTRGDRARSFLAASRDDFDHFTRERRVVRRR